MKYSFFIYKFLDSEGYAVSYGAGKGFAGDKHYL